MIKFENVSKRYEEGTIAVDSLNMEIKKGEFFVLIGPSGCGKTTTLKMINRLIPLTEGTIFFDENNISEYNIYELRWNIGYVLQQIALFPHMSIEDNITVVPEMKKWTKEKMKERAFELMKMVGLDPQTYTGRKPNELSGGEQQRVGVIRALAADPDIILMDEPFSALDPISREKLQDVMLDLKRNLKKTTVFVTHDMQEALKLADRICIMKDGRIVQIGTPQELLIQPANDFVKEFVGNKSGNWIDDMDWEAIIQPMTQSDRLQNYTTVIPIATPLKKVIDILADHEQLAVEKDGERIGVINRKTIIQFLSTKLPERGSTK